MSWEDILKRGRVPPKKPKKDKPDTGWSKPKPKPRTFTPEETKDFINRLNAEEKERYSKLNPLDRILEDNERDRVIAEDRRRKERKPRLAPKKPKRKEIARQKLEGTYRPKKGQQRKQDPRATTPKMTRSQRKAANEAKKRRQANEVLDAREDAARDARDRRRGL